MPEFKSLAELENYLNGKIRNALEQEVSEEAVKTMQEHIQSDVYDRYSPAPSPNGYVRTGALADEKNIQHTMINDNTLEIENVRADEQSGRLVAPVIESGTGYEWADSEIYQRQPFPRPFVENTAQDLASGKAKNALAEGLKRQGLNVE